MLEGSSVTMLDTTLNMVTTFTRRCPEGGEDGDHVGYHGRAALRIVLVTVPRVGRSCEHFPDGFDVHLLLRCG